MSMNQTIAGLYNTAGVQQPTNEDHEKVAQAQLFAKLASDNNINLNELSNDQITELWETTFGKEAQEEGAEEGGGKPPFPPKKEEKGEKEEEEDDEEEKKEAAVAEFYQVKTAHDQVAFFDYCGRVMAHSYVNELSKIASAQGEDGQAKEAAAAESSEEQAQRIAKLASAAPGMPQAAEGRSTTQNFDLFAARHAVELAKQAGVDENEVVSKLNSVLTLGAPASTKLASASDIDQGVQVRALELLENAGYKVDWNS